MTEKEFVREVEIKARVRDDDLTTLAKALEAMPGGLSSPVLQSDRIFVLSPLKLSQVDGAVSPLLRLRTEGGCTSFTLKRDLTDQLDSLELEVVVEPAEPMPRILAELGFHEVAHVVKERREATVDRISIKLDVVEGLGGFVECEMMLGPDDNVTACRREMWDLLGRWGVGESDAVREGYDRMIDAMSTQDGNPDTLR